MLRVYDLFIRSISPIICRNEGILDQTDDNSLDIDFPGCVVAGNPDGDSFTFKADISHEVSLKSDITSFEEEKSLGACCHSSFVFGYILAEGFPHNQRSLVTVPFLCLLIIGIVGHQLVLNVCIIGGRLERPRDVFRNFHRKRI